MSEATPQGRDICFGTFRFDAATLELWSANEPVPLAPKPARILAALTAKPGRLVTRQELYAVGWAEGTLSVDLALNAAIRQLRRSLGERAGGDGLIQTLPGRGYRFVGEVHRVDPEHGKGTRPSREIRAARRRSRVPAWPAGGLITACIALAWLAAASPQPATVVVTPIRVLDDSGASVDTVMLVESIRNRVARTSGRSIAVLASGKLPPSSGLEPEFMVESLLYQTVDGETRLDVRVVRTDTGTIVWSGWFDPHCPYAPDTAATVARYVTGVLDRAT